MLLFSILNALYMRFLDIFLSLNVMKQFVILASALVLFVSCGSSEPESEVQNQKNTETTTSQKTNTSSEQERLREEYFDLINGTYIWNLTMPGPVSKVEISGLSWSSELCIPTDTSWNCDIERNSGSIRDNRLYDAGGYMEVGEINVSGPVVTVALFDLKQEWGGSRLHRIPGSY